jgi:hypothetical protein
MTKVAIEYKNASNFWCKQNLAAVVATSRRLFVMSSSIRRVFNVNTARTSQNGISNEKARLTVGSYDVTSYERNRKYASVAVKSARVEQGLLKAAIRFQFISNHVPFLQRTQTVEFK